MRRVAVCVCTYRRNGPLARLLERLADIQAASSHLDLTIIVADDNLDLRARPLVESYDDRFRSGTHHVESAAQNISIARNALLSAALELADILVMTDDDCLPEPQWIDALLATHDRTNADAVSGPMFADVPDQAPRWISDQSLFDALEQFPRADVPIDHGQTNNCLLSCDWLRRHPDHRFDPRFGRLGGEDMVFFRGAVKHGLESHFSVAARVHAIEPLEQLSLRSLLRTYYWLGNSEAVTNLHLETVGRGRLILRGLRRMAGAYSRPIVRLLRAEPAHIRTSMILAARGAGITAGGVGLRARHH